MASHDFTVVLGVDASHLDQLRLTLPTWERHKPTMIRQPIVVFYDVAQVDPVDIYEVVPGHAQLVPWPPPGVTYDNVGDTRFGAAQRYKMLSGFVHVPPAHVKTPYWLKVDTDVVAVAFDDWLDTDWFADAPAWVGHHWTYTKPPDQMQKLDAWVAAHADKLPELEGTAPLNLVPPPGWGRLPHSRFTSFCALFQTAFSRMCADMAARACGAGRLPVPSQDGFVWYVAARMRLRHLAVNMKQRGWQQWHTMANIRANAESAMAREPMNLEI